MRGRTGEVLSRLVRPEPDASSLTDRELLHRFAESGDEAAFATLVARHSRMVLGVCRRQLPTVQDAEDACQATFLILARKAGGGRWQSSVANWLYTTARQVVAKAHRSAARRTKREGRAAVSEAVPALDEISGRELLAVLDEELGKLPALYREPLVLCYLEGLSREDAAARLGVPWGTVKTRLERGRKRLEAALTRRGIGPGLGLLALAITSPVGASPPQLADTVRVAVSGSPPAAVAALAQGALVNRVLRKVLVVVAAGASAVGLGLGWHTVGPVAVGQVTDTHAGSLRPAGVGTAPARSAVKVPPPLTPGFVTAAPVPKEGDEQFLKDVAAAREKAIRFLKGRQMPDGTWDGPVSKALTDMEGGGTTLVALALLEAGVPTDDPVVAKTVDYLVKLSPKKTYVVSLQTQVLVKVDPKKHAGQIQKNTDWLIDQAIGLNDKGRLAGWSYPGGQSGDGSNTHFAVFALHTAARAGAKVDDKIWVAIREHYVRTRKDGGWAYQDVDFAFPTESMTAAALVGLAVAGKYDRNSAAGREAFEKGMNRLLAMSTDNPKSAGYQMLVTAELGRAIGSAVFKSGDKVVAWYTDGATKLVRGQQSDGSWVVHGKGVDGDEVISTAFGLYFLGPPEKK
ncbi:MAG: Prenyltransferase and squalene oxidase repeat protein [Gemmataceae bacterium]|nr:Prenyltransferase and squalene oxidase repeat protein [Gemmataceae bacterium]